MNVFNHFICDRMPLPSFFHCISSTFPQISFPIYDIVILFGAKMWLNNDSVSYFEKKPLIAVLTKEGFFYFLLLYKTCRILFSRRIFIFYLNPLYQFSVFCIFLPFILKHVNGNCHLHSYYFHDRKHNFLYFLHNS